MNPKTLSNYYSKELVKIKTLFHNHGIEASIVLNKLEQYKDKDEVYGITGTLIDIPTFICSSIEEHRQFYTVKFTESEERNLIVKLIEIYNSLEIPENLKDNYKTAFASKLMNLLIPMLRDKVVTLDIDKMKYDVVSIDNEYINNRLSKEFTKNKIKPSKVAKKINLEDVISKLIKNSQIKSPKIVVIKSTSLKNMSRVAKETLREVDKESDLERYRRLQHKLVKMSEDVNSPTLLRKFIKKNCKVTDKGLYIKNKSCSDYLLISMSGLSTENKAVAYRTSNEKFREFITNNLMQITNILGYSLHELKPILVTYFNCSDLRLKIG